MKLKLITVGVSLLLVAAFAVGCTPGETVGSTDTETESVTVAETTVESETEAETETAVDTEADTLPATESDTESETEAETEPLEKGYAVLFKEALQKERFDITAESSIGLRFTVAEKYALDSITTECLSGDDRIGSMQLCFYRWDTDYATTVAAEPVFTYTLENFISAQWDTQLMGGLDHAYMTVDLPAGTIGEGEWLYLYQNGSGNVAVNRVGANRTPFPGDDGGVIDVAECYANGTTTNRYPASHVTYAPVEASAETPADPDGYTKLSAGKAHVILLGGQSNAAGASYVPKLANTVAREDLERYNRGYDNVYIYTALPDFTNNGFVKCRLGVLSKNSATFGPELGLADYLARTYPNETFYIVKSAIGGTNLSVDWNVGGSAYTLFDNHVTNALEALEAQGLEPEIFAMLWMQGESDADIMSQRTKDYVARFDALIERIETKYADYMAEGGMAIVDSAICEQSVWQYAAIINQMKEKYAATSQNYYFLDSNAAGIDTWDEMGDPMHYDSDDMIELGELFGRYVGQILTNAGY